MAWPGVTAGRHGQGSRLGVTAGYITSSAPSRGNRALPQPSGMFPSRPGVGELCWSRRAGELCGGLGHALAEPVTTIRRAAKHGRMLPELCPELSLLRRFKCHPLKHAFAATAAAQTDGTPRLLLAPAPCPPSTGQGGPRLWACPRAGRPAVAVGPVQGVSAKAGLCPRGLGGLTPSPHPVPPTLQTGGKGETQQKV